jgi:glycosyltransferase involved in cell wall biosynthesis
LNKIKVVHLVAGNLNGGAARGAYWLHKGLLDLGVDSRIITNYKDNLNDPNIITLASTKFKRLIALGANNLDTVLLKLWPKRNGRIFSTGFGGLNFKSNQFYQDADIVHLHWINGLVKTKAIKNLGKPAVWSVRDMWPVTGGCHYSMDCDRYKIGCGSCPQLGSTKKIDLTSLIARLKRGSYKNIHPVGISDWVTSVIDESFVFCGNKAITIANNIDCSVFFPVPQKIARELLGINTEKKIILIGSTNLRDFYKGFSVFFESLNELNPEKYCLCVFGKPDIPTLEATGFEYKVLGYLFDDISLRLAYSAADVFVAPSIQEAFGKTLAEALSCGTPVVCFDATGPASIVEHKIDGYKATPFKPESLADGIKWILHDGNYGLLSVTARENALKKFDSAVAARKYLNLYSELLSKDTP